MTTKYGKLEILNQMKGTENLTVNAYTIKMLPIKKNKLVLSKSPVILTKKETDTNFNVQAS